LFKILNNENVCPFYPPAVNPSDQDINHYQDTDTQDESAGFRYIDVTFNLSYLPSMAGHSATQLRWPGSQNR
jgi:hypothetical protein